MTSSYGLDITSQLGPRFIPTVLLPTGLYGLIHQPDHLPFSVPALLITSGTGILTRFPSTTPIGLALGAGLPYPD